jgi:hypothetical protein
MCFPSVQYAICLQIISRKQISAFCRKDLLPNTYICTYVHTCKIWFWRRVEKVSYTDRVRNGKDLHTVNEEGNVQHTVKERLIGWVISCTESVF